MTNRECIHKMWIASKGFRPRIALITAIGVFFVCISMLFVWVSKHLVDIATGQTQGNLKMAITIMIGCMLLQVTISVIGRRIESLMTVRLNNDLRIRLFNHLMMSRWVGKEKFHTGDMLNRMGGDVGTVSGIICHTASSAMITSFQLAVAFIYLCTMDYRLAFTLIIIMPIALLVSKFYIKRMRKLTKEIRETDSRVQVHIQESLQHRILLRTMEQTAKSVNRLADLQKHLFGQVKRRTDFGLFSRTMVQVGFDISYAVAFLWGIWGLMNGTVTFGMMTAFLQLVMQVQQPIVELSKQVPAVVHSFTAVERLAELEALPTEEIPAPIRMEGTVGIRLKNIDFKYSDGKRKVLDGFSYDFTPGSFTALVGETGAGKTTLIRLMLALLKPDKGTICLYNKTKERMVSTDTRSNIVYVPQGNTLMSGSVRDNLLLGNPSASDTELSQALYRAAAEFVFDLPEALDTLCGEKGAGLSEGQAQRIAIARGLLRSGGILLLDEPTSSLDAETERTLLERIASEMEGKTLIVVTHRETVTQLCTNTVSLERIVNQNSINL